MHRRELIKALVGTFTFLCASNGLADVVVNYPGNAGTPTLTAQQLNLLAKLVDCVIPDTDTPGASKAGVPQFIDYMLGNFHGAAKTDTFTTGMAALDALCTQISGQGLAATDSLKITALLMDLERQENDSPARSFALWLKELTVLGYYTSEIGASQELHYLAIPGSYSSCIDFKEGMRTWAT
jgi:gluconate 2-dehydrogenase gamma chain